MQDGEVGGATISPKTKETQSESAKYSTRPVSATCVQEITQQRQCTSLGAEALHQVTIFRGAQEPRYKNSRKGQTNPQGSNPKPKTEEPREPLKGGPAACRWQCRTPWQTSKAKCPAQKMKQTPPVSRHGLTGGIVVMSCQRPLQSCHLSFQTRDP